MECNDLLHYLSDYIDNNLDDDLVAEAQEHLATCHNCKVILDTTQQTIALMLQQEKRVIPAHNRKKLFNQLQEAFLKSTKADK